jgi:hypothetical protein
VRTGSLTTDASQASPIPSASVSVWSALDASGQLSGPPRLTQRRDHSGAPATKFGCCSAAVALLFPSYVDTALTNMTWRVFREPYSEFIPRPVYR